jgi:PEP-CTERM motif-containing protein
MRRILCMTCFLFALAVASEVTATPIVFSAGGDATAASIQPTVDAFRAQLGATNNGNGGSTVGGRREINWDGGGALTPSVTPGPLLTAFQNSRGATFTTPGTQFAQASPEDLASAALLNQPGYATDFQTFSPLRLFTPFGSNITDTDFSLPGTGGAQNATTTAFGAVFADVDAPGTAIQFFDINDMLLFSLAAPVFPGGLSFAGVMFDAGEQIARVRLVTGTALPGAVDGTASDVVVMDDFIYAEPQAVPEPATLLLSGIGLAGLCGRALKRRRAVRAE